jgi:hypothetical protein
MFERINIDSLKNRTLIFYGQRAQVIAINKDDDMVYIRRGTQPLLERTFSELVNEISAQSVILVKNLAQPVNKFNATPEQQVEITRREAYFFAMAKYKNPTKHAEEVIQKVSFDIEDPIGFSRSDLCKKWKIFVTDSYSAAAQVLCKNRDSSNRIIEDVEKLMTYCIHNHFLVKGGVSGSRTWEYFSDEFDKRGYKCEKPCKRTLQRRINKISEFEKVRTRLGESEAKKRFRQKFHKYDIQIPLEEVQLDSGHFNVGLLEYADGKKFYMGTVSIDLAFDVGTASLLGYCVHVGKKSEHSGFIVNMLSHAINQKPGSDHIQFGLPRFVKLDAGVGYRAETTRLFLDTIQCEYEITAVRTPWAKAFVESFIKKLRLDFFQGTKGYLGKFDPDIYTDTGVKAEAQLTIEQFKQKLANYVREYHNTPLKRLKNLTPNQAWIEGTKQFPPEVVDDVAELRKYKGLKINRQYNIQYGLTHQYEYFNAPILLSLYDEYCKTKSAHGTKNKKTKQYELFLDFLVDPNDASAISVIVPDALCKEPGRIELIEIPNTDSNSNGKSFAQLDAVRNGTKILNGAPVFVDYEGKSGYRDFTPPGDLIDISNGELETPAEIEAELDSILTTPAVNEYHSDTEISDEVFETMTLEKNEVYLSE